MNCASHSRVQMNQMDLNAQLSTIFWKPGREAKERCRPTQPRVCDPILGTDSPSKGEQDTPKQINDLKARLDNIFKVNEHSAIGSNHLGGGHGKNPPTDDGDSASIKDLRDKLEAIFKIKARSRIVCENRPLDSTKNRYTDGDSYSEHSRMTRDQEDTMAQEVMKSPTGRRMEPNNGIQHRVRHKDDSRTEKEYDSEKKRWDELNAKLNAIFGKSQRGFEVSVTVPEVLKVVKPFIEPLPEETPTVVPPKKQADLLRRYQLKRLPEIPKPVTKRTNEEMVMERLKRHGPIIAGPNTANIFGKTGIVRIELKGSKQCLKPEDAASQQPVRKGPDQVSLMLKAKREAREKKLQSTLNPRNQGGYSSLTAASMPSPAQVLAPGMSKSEQIQKQIHDLVLKDSDPNVRSFSKDQRFLDLMAALEPVFKPSLPVKLKVKAYQELFSPPNSPRTSSGTNSARSTVQDSGYPNGVIEQVERDISQIAKMDRVRYPSIF